MIYLAFYLEYMDKHVGKYVALTLFSCFEVFAFDVQLDNGRVVDSVYM